jgi:hypothetical protein
MTRRSWRLMLADLARSGLDAEDAARMRLTPILGTTRGPGYRIPYFDKDGGRTGFYRTRWRDGKRYSQRRQPEGSKIQVYFPPGFAALDPTLPLYIAEGEKKGALLVKLGYRAVAIGGVDMFRSRKGGSGLHPDLRSLASGEVRIAFDGNAATNADVIRARSELAMRLMKHGADVRLIDLPDPKANLDNWIVEHGQKAFDALEPRHLSVRETIAAIRSAKLSVRAKRKQISDVVLTDMQARGLFFRTEEGLQYFDREGHKPINVDVSAAVPVRCHLNEVYDINASEAEYQFVYEDLRTLASNHGTEIDLRYFAHYQPDKCRLYLAASETAMFKVESEGLELVPNGTDDVVLRVPKDMQAVKASKKPADRSAMDQLLALPNIVDGEHATEKQMRLLYELWIWGVLFGIDALPTRPIVLMHGPKGSAKTAGGRGLIRTLMGKNADVSTFSPTKMDGFDAALTNQHLVVADNIDGGRYHGIEDKLAVAATGGKLELRKLYSTNEQVRIAARAFVIITSRAPKSFTRDDVVDRLLYLKVARRKNYRAEREIMRDVARKRSAFWRYVLDTAPKLLLALCERPPATNEFRMADFAEFALCIGPAIGYSRKEVHAALAAGESEKLAFAAEQSELANALAELVKDKPKTSEFFEKSHTATELLQELVDRPGGFRRMAPTTFGQRLHSEWEAICQRVRIARREDKKAKAYRYTLEKPT